MNIIQRFKSLPVKSRSLLSIGAIVALVLALPLFIWGIMNLTYDLRERASSGEPLPNSVNWTTPYVSFQADGFYITANGKTYYGNTSDVQVTSDPGSSQYTTLEVIWHENGDEMRMFIYFEADGSTWWTDEIRVYNGQSPSPDWAYYYGTNTFLRNLGYAFEQNTPGVLIFGGSDAEIHFSNLRVQAFLSSTPPPTACTSVPMTINATPAKHDGIPGSIKRYQIDVTNNDSEGCGDATVYLNASAPIYVPDGTTRSGWTSNFTAENFVVGSHDTYTTYLDVKSPNASYSVGEHSITVNLSNANIPQNAASKSFIYNLTSPIGGADPTATATATAAPVTSGEPNNCNGTCGSHSNCQGGLFCSSGYCRNPLCPTSSNCNCSTASTAKSSAKPTPTIEVVYLKTTPKASVSPKATTSPIATSLPIQTVATTNNLKRYGLIGLAVIGLLLILIALANLLKNRGNN